MKLKAHMWHQCTNRGILARADPKASGQLEDISVQAAPRKVTESPRLCSMDTTTKMSVSQILPSQSGEGKVRDMAHDMEEMSGKIT